MTLLDEVVDASREPLGAARSLPFAAYTDPELFALEQERIFRNEWIPLCAERALANPGDAFATTLAGEPLVVLRGRDGELRALSNACRHRGTPIVDEGFSQAQRLVCPYHAWAYDDTGGFRGAPHTGSVEIDPARHGLARFALEVWRGIAFVHLGPNPKPLADRVAGIDAQLAGYALDRFDVGVQVGPSEVWEANWKVVLENGLESYHIFRLHPESLEPELPTRMHSYLAGGRDWALTPGRRERPADAQDWPETDAFAREHYVVTSLPPSLYGGLVVEGWPVVFVHPLSPERTRVSTALFLASGREEAFGRGPFGVPAAGTVLEEDRAMCERVQRGMHARAGAPGQLVELEQILVDFHTYLADRLTGSP